MLKEHELGYLAGIIDGEGTLRTARYDKVDGGVNYYPRLTVVMTDKDIIDWLASSTGMGVTYSKPTKEAHHLNQWVWDVNKKNDTLDLLIVIRNLVGYRRRQKIDEILAKVTALEKGV